MVVKVTRTFATTVRGVGKPDYSKEISLGQTRPGVTLKYRQSLKFFAILPTSDVSAYTWCIPPIAAGATQSLMDGETGLYMPFTVPIGYTLDIFSFMMKPQEDVTFVLFMDGQHFLELGLTTSGLSVMMNDIIPLGTCLIDPTAALPHEFDIRAINLGSGALEMGCVFYCLYEAVGTPPPPTTKDVKCRVCGHIHTVSINTSSVICPRCGALTTYLDLSGFRGSR